jgi:polyphosphate kinase
MQRSLDRFHRFDLDDPVLPDWIGDNALTSGGYPCTKKLSRRAYRKQLKALQVEFVKLLEWRSETGSRSILAFEGRDAAGKGGSLAMWSSRSRRW